jgi:hypothetical protein
MGPIDGGRDVPEGSALSALDRAAGSLVAEYSILHGIEYGQIPYQPLFSALREGLKKRFFKEPVSHVHETTCTPSKCSELRGLLCPSFFASSRIRQG